MYFATAALLVTTGVVFLCGASEGCYNNFQTCSQQNAALVQSAMSGSSIDISAFCSGLQSVQTCLNTDTADCTSAPPPEVMSLKTMIDNSTRECAVYNQLSSPCKGKVSECTNIAVAMAKNITIGMVQAGTNSTSAPSLGAIFTLLCPILKSTQTCFQEMQTMCPEAKSIIPTGQYETQLAPFCGSGSSGGSVEECVDKMMVCTNRTLDATNILTAGGQPNIQQYCVDIKKAMECYSNFATACPALGATAVASMSQVSSQITTLCGGSGTPSIAACSVKQQECSNRTMMASTKMPQNGQALDPAVMTQFCEEMTGAITCYNETIKMCSVLAPAIAPAIKQYSSMAEMYCGTDLPSGCRTKKDGCMGKFIETCQNAGVQGSFEQKQACCRVSEEMFKCLDDAGCPESMFLIIGHRSLLQMQTSKLCEDYKEYCPGVETCWNNVDSLEELCPKTEAVFSCIETKCANTATQNPTLSKMKPLITEICAGLQNYPAISTCYPFGVCTGTTVTTLPGTVQSLRSMASAGSSEHWCRFAKGVSTCTSQVAKSGSCSIGGNFTTEVAALKSSIDSTCTNVRDPCPAALICLSKLQSSSMAENCREIPGFVKCVDAALATCGEASKVKAKYSLNDISLKFVRFCSVVSSNAEITNCTAVQPCMALPQQADTASSLSDYTDQTYWANFLEGMARCTVDAGVSCNLPQSATKEMIDIYTEVKALSGEKKSVNDDDGNDNSGTTAVSSLLFLFVFPVLIFFKLN